MMFIARSRASLMRLPRCRRCTSTGGTEVVVDKLSPLEIRVHKERADVRSGKKSTIYFLQGEHSPLISIYVAILNSTLVADLNLHDRKLFAMQHS